MDIYSILFPTPGWPSAVFYVMSIITIPLYILVLICLLRIRCVSKTYNNTFYTIMLQHKSQSAPKLLIILVYWLVPILISLTLMKNGYLKYNSLETMGVIGEKEVLQRNTLIALIVVSITCILCSLAYCGLYFFIKKHSEHLQKSLRHEISLAIQVFILLIAFFAIQIYYVVQNHFSQTQNTGPIFYMRGIYPMFNGFLSYINPYCILILNKDFAKHVWKSVTCRGELEVSDAPASVIPHNCILPMTQTRELSKVDF
ncbi:Protein CBG00816 [Caenorhabditis briggsae]|uniref:Protein CBG00816 n=1 Tax=Caenorhabditis briggsae TaxID=6238 RepID=A8WNW7_CAEBR|nr:Protein CBG00816 [Caenorhabditis briggsae]CAP22173.2 Protein CBG00816 [Caenorhabditis briggsae]